MKKAIFLMAVFTMIIGIDATAQISETRTTDTEIYQVENTQTFPTDRNEASVKKNRKTHLKRRKAAKKAQAKRIKAMRKIAKADGVITPEEKATIKAERRKMKNAAKKRAKKHRIARKNAHPDTEG